MTSNVENLTSQCPYNGEEQVYIGNGNGLPIQNIGMSVININNSANENLFIKKLLHAPAISKNLSSVSRFTKDNNVYFEFHADKCIVKCRETKKILLEGAVMDCLYALPVLKFSGVNSFSCNQSALLSVSSS